MSDYACMVDNADLCCWISPLRIIFTFLGQTAGYIFWNINCESCANILWKYGVKSYSDIKNLNLFYVTSSLCISFPSHLWIWTGVTDQKCSIWVKSSICFSRVTLKFDRWPWKTIGHLFYAISNFVHDSIGICEFKLELWSRNSKIGTNFFTFVTLTFDLWPWHFAWTSLLSMVIIPENYEQAVKDGWTGRLIDRRKCC